MDDIVERLRNGRFSPLICDLVHGYAENVPCGGAESRADQGNQDGSDKDRFHGLVAFSM